MPIGTPTFLAENSANSETITIPAGGVAAGDTLVVACGSSGSDVLTGITDSKGNTYTVDDTEAGVPFALSSGSSKLTTALVENDTVTITRNGAGSFVKVVLIVVTGLADTPVDKVASASGTGTTPSSGATAATTQADEIVLGFCSFDAALASNDFSAGAGFTKIGEWNTNGDRTVAVEYEIVSATGAQTADGTLGTSVDWNMSVVTFKGEAGGTTHFGAAALTGTGSLTAAGERTATGAAALSGAGSLSAAGQRTAIAAASLSGAGSLTAQGVRTTFGAAALSGVGTLAASGVRTTFGAAALSGLGSLVASGTVTSPGTTHFGAASLTGTGSLTASGQRTAIGSAALSGTGSLTAAGQRTAIGAASLSGQGSLTAQGVRTTFGAASLSGVGSLVASGVVTAPELPAVYDVAEYIEPTVVMTFPVPLSPIAVEFSGAERLEYESAVRLIEYDSPTAVADYR